MAIPANLVVDLTFNPPRLSIVGPIRETTISKLQSILPQVCTSAPGQNTAIQFERKEVPPHWFCELNQAYANEEMGQSQIMLTILDCLEEEGGWKMKGSCALNHDDTQVTYKFFFVRPA